MDSRFIFEINDPNFITPLYVRADSYSSAISHVSSIFGDSIMSKVSSITKIDSLWIKH